MRARSQRHPVIRLCTLAAAALLAFGGSGLAHADGLFDSDNPNALQVHAFLSQGYLKTNTYNYLAKSQSGSFAFTEAGINFTKDLTDNLRVGLQLFAYDLGPLGNYAPRFDWYYLDYRFRDWLGIRAGHTKIPFGLYNDSSDFDAARVPILLPQSVYPVDHQDYLLALTGGEIYGNIRMGVMGALEYRAYGGTLDLNSAAVVPAPGITVGDVSEPYIAGGRLMWTTPLEGLRVGGSGQALGIHWKYNFDPALSQALEAAGLLPPDFNNVLATRFTVQLWMASLEYQVGNLLLAAEYSRWIAEFDTEAPKLLPPEIVNERYYAMASYRVFHWFTPGAYFSSYTPDVDKRDGQKQDYQHDLAVTLRFDINAHWLIKLEGHWMQGTAAIDPTLNGGTSPADLTHRDWALFMVKTTAYF